MKKLTYFFLLVLITLNTSAQETIKLTVNGQGATKEEATANALRSAIEQSFGVFVSANTQILNDEVVKNEIATIASGNIQEYKELGCITMPNGQQSVSLSATVSIGNLISYAKSKGSSAEFAGKLFAMNMKIHKLNAENEKKVIEHLFKQLLILVPDLFRVDISLRNPIELGTFNHHINTKGEYINGFKLTKDESYYSVPIKLDYYTTEASKLFYSTLTNTLKSLALSESEIIEYKNSNKPLYLIGGKDSNEYLDKEEGGSSRYGLRGIGIKMKDLYFRTDFYSELRFLLYNIFKAAALFSTYDLNIKGLNETHKFTYYNNEFTIWHRPISSSRNRLWGKYTTEPLHSHYDKFFGNHPSDIIDLEKLNTVNILARTEIPEILFTEKELYKIESIEMKKNSDALLRACSIFNCYYPSDKNIYYAFKNKIDQGACIFSDEGNYIEFTSNVYSLKSNDVWGNWIEKPIKIRYYIPSRSWEIETFYFIEKVKYRQQEGKFNAPLSFHSSSNSRHEIFISKYNDSNDFYIIFEDMDRDLTYQFNIPNLSQQNGNK